MVAFGGAEEFGFKNRDQLGGTHKGKEGLSKLNILLWISARQISSLRR
jgi:hypothetical protein